MLDRFQLIPEMASIAEKQPGISPARIARKLTIEAIKSGKVDGVLRKGILPTADAKAILTAINEKSDSNRFAWEIVLNHLVLKRGDVFLLANIRVHPDMWKRDFAQVSEFIESSALDDNVYKTFERRQRANGQIPTAVGLIGNTPWHFADDESTLLYVIGVDQLVQSDKSKLTAERKKHVKSALNFIRQHDCNNLYVTPKGERRGWLDAFIYPKTDVVTQNQGLYAVALLAANRLGFPVSADEIKNVSKLYQTMAQFHGYLPLSYGFNAAPDISALYPEYLAMTRFKEPLLTDQIARSTLDAVPKSKHGYKVLTMSPQGEYFDPSCFVARYAKGQYQNGGVWPLWNNLALVVAELHGIAPNNYRQTVLDQLVATKSPESIRTGGRFEEVLTPERPNHVWNVAIYAQHRNADRIK